MRVTDFGQSRRPETGKAVTGPMDGAAVINNKKDALLWGKLRGCHLTGCGEMHHAGSIHQTALSGEAF